MSRARFDLWRDPWIHVRGGDGAPGLVGLRGALAGAHLWRDLADPSPLAVVGIHRLLVAILQDALQPQTDRDLAELWRGERLPEGALEAFERDYGGCFDLFSAERPFLQSADLGIEPSKGDNVKTVLYLLPEWPAGSEATHYRHGRDSTAALCPACAAAGLVTQPAFATSGGSGIKPSINGVPPLYVLPQGETLAQSLIASLVTPARRPVAADPDSDEPWWRHAPTIGFKDERERVGYLHSLTFPARQVRLHPTPSAGEACTRCGAQGEWLVRTMIYNMGESRVGGADFWQDPFVAYAVRGEGKGPPIPLRPQAGRALWRDYAALFLDVGRDEGSNTLRPMVLAQVDSVADLAGRDAAEVLRVRCVGMRTDMKAKVFEWVDEGLQVPLSLLHTEAAALEIEEGLGFAERIQGDLYRAWGSCVEGRPGRYRAHRQRMAEQYWGALATDFQAFALGCARAAGDDDVGKVDAALAGVRRSWAMCVCRRAEEAFSEAAGQLGDDAVSLRQRVQGEAYCRGLIHKHRREYAPDDD